MSELIYSLFGGSVTLIAILLFLFRHPDKFEHWMAIFYKFALSVSSHLPQLKRKFDRRAVASSIQDCVNGTSERIDKQAPGVLPHALRIEWVDTDTPESFIRKGRAVVRLKHFQNQDKNLVDSTILYLNIGLLPRARHYLDSLLRKSTEYRIASQIFLTRRDTGAYGYFFENVLTPALKSEPPLEADLQTLEHLDSAGFFIQVFLSEVKQVGDRLVGSIPTPAIQRELRDFALFLETIATKGGDEIVPLEFEGAKVRASVVLVARKETIRSFGIDPYVNRVRRNVNRGFDSIYVTGWGEEFVQKIHQIRAEIDRHYVTVLRRYDFVLRATVKAILLVCQSNISHLARQRELKQEVEEAMLEIVPEVKKKEIEVVSVARIKGVGCKISVRPAAGQDDLNATGACIGEGAERVNKLKENLGGEFVAIVDWSEIPQEYVANALKPLREAAVESIEIDESQLVASVTLGSEEGVRKAFGKDGANLKLASQLTGWHIILKGPQTRTDSTRPEDELLTLCSRFIREIQNGDIEIARSARIRGIGSRVVVKWRSRGGKRILASQACAGSSGGILRQLQTELNGERLYFHEWYDDPRELIIGCLYPMKKIDIQSTTLDQASNTATVTLKPTSDRRPFRLDPYNVALTERVTGWRIQFVNS